jgi:hypothetical protein
MCSAAPRQQTNITLADKKFDCHNKAFISSSYLAQGLVLEYMKKKASYRNNNFETRAD